MEIRFKIYDFLIELLKNSIVHISKAVLIGDFHEIEINGKFIFQ